VPGYDAISAVSRLAVPGLLGASIFAAWGLKRLMVRFSVEMSMLVVSLAVAVVVLELYVEPIRADVPEPTVASTALAEMAPGAVVELPMREVWDAQFALIEGPRMLISLGDWRPRFNGYSGDSPPDYVANIVALNRFPEPDSLATAAELGIRYVILHSALESSDSAYSLVEIQVAINRLPTDFPVRRFGDAWFIDLKPPGNSS
jgi:hypothetical protein